MSAAEPAIGNREVGTRNGETEVVLEPVGQALMTMVRHPARTFVRAWNWKTAFLSAAVRSPVFFFVTINASARVVAQAFSINFLVRGVLAGCTGALIQRLRYARPRWAATAAVVVLVPATSQGIEALIHWSAGTPHLTIALAASLAITVCTTAGDLWAMRLGLLTVGPGANSLTGDVMGFVRAVRVAR